MNLPFLVTEERSKCGIRTQWHYFKVPLRALRSGPVNSSSQRRGRGGRGGPQRQDCISSPTRLLATSGTNYVGWVEAVKADTHRDECMMGIATLNPSYACSAHLGVLSVHCVKGLLKIAALVSELTE